MNKVSIDKKRKFFSSIILICLVGLLIYFPLLEGEYVWDDTLIFVSKTALLNRPLSWSLLMEPVLPGVNYFRPLVMFTWYSEFRLFGQHATISHSINILIYLFNCVLTFAVCYRLSVNEKRYAIGISLLAALLYAVHPALIETTSWVSGRFDQMVTLGILLGSLVYLNPKPFDWKKSLQISICFLIALGSKELGVIMPAILLCFGLGLMQNKTDPNLLNFNKMQRVGILINKTRMLLKTQSKLWICCLVILIIYGYQHGKYSGANENIAYGIYYAETIKTLKPFFVLWQYCQTVFLPFHSVSNLHPEIEIDYLTLSGRLKAIAGLLLFIGILANAILRQTLNSFLILASLIGIVLVLHFIPLGIVGNTMHERFMTLSMSFICIVLVRLPWQCLIEKTSIRPSLGKGILFLIVCSWILVAAITSFSVAKFWRSDLELWNWSYRMHPESVIARYNFLSGALEKGRGDLVLKELAKYKKKHGGLEVADQILYANTLMRQGNPESIKYYEGALYAMPKFHEQVDGKSKINRFWLTAMQMAGAYMDFATCQVIFNGDIDKALFYNSIASWYLDEDESLPVLYQRAALYYLKGERHDAESLRTRISKNDFMHSDTFNHGMGVMINNYCKLKEHDFNSCEYIKANNLYPGLNF